MNAQQRRAIWIGVTLIALMGLIPPWAEHYRAGGRSVGYSLIFDPPGNLTSIDVTRLLIQWVVVIVVVIARVLTAHPLPPRARPGDEEIGETPPPPTANVPPAEAGGLLQPGMSEGQRIRAARRQATQPPPQTMPVTGGPVPPVMDYLQRASNALASLGRLLWGLIGCVVASYFFITVVGQVFTPNFLAQWDVGDRWVGAIALGGAGWLIWRLRKRNK